MEFLHFACMSNCPSTKKYWAKTYTERVCISINWLRHWATETETEHCENIHVSFHAAFIFCMFSTIWTRQDVLLIFSELEQMSQITCTSTWDFLINKLEQNFYFELLARCWKLKHGKNCEICHTSVLESQVLMSTVFFPDLSVQMSPQMAPLKSLNGCVCKEVGGCTQASWRLSDLI